MAGYANPARRPGLGLGEGWLRSADLGCRTAGGLLKVLGRADEVLVIGGVNVLPGAVVDRLAAAPGVGEVAVVGLPEPVWEHRLIALYTGPAEGMQKGSFSAAIAAPVKPKTRWVRETRPSDRVRDGTAVTVARRTRRPYSKRPRAS